MSGTVAEVRGTNSMPGARGRRPEASLWVLWLAAAVALGAVATLLLSSRPLAASLSRANALGIFRGASMPEVAARADEPRTAETLQRLAAARREQGEPEAARKLLEEATRLEPQSAAILTGLAAAELGLGRIADATENAGRALHRDPENLEAAFLWARGLQAMSNRFAAIDAWERYLELDPEGDRAEEARRQLFALHGPRATWLSVRHRLSSGASDATIARLVARYPRNTRARSHNVLLPEWARTGDPGILAVVRTVAALRVHKDGFLRDVVEHAAANRQAVLPGLTAFGEAWTAQADNRIGAALRLYGEASALLSAAGSPLAIAAEIYRAQNESNTGESDAAVARLNAVRSRAAAYPSMASEAEWLRALDHLRRAEAQEAIDGYGRAIDLARRGGEVEHEVSMTVELVLQFELLDERERADRYRLESLRRLDETDADADRLYLAFMETAFTLLHTGRPRVALTFIESQRRLAVQKKNPHVFLAESEGQRALALFAIGRFRDAENSLAVARTHAIQVESDGLRDRKLADLDAIRGTIHRQTRPREAMAALGSAVDLYRKLDWRIHAARQLLARGEVALAVGDRRAAEQDFRDGIAEMEKQRRGIEEPVMRISYFERADRLFERLIDLLVEDGRAAEALSVTEAKRARVLLEQLSGGDASPLDAEEIARTVTGETAVLEIALLDGGAELWLVRDGSIMHRRTDVSGAEIESGVRRHLAAIAARDKAAVQREGRRLFEQLVAPVAADLPAGTDLVIVADGVLQTFPFATLVTRDGRYLIERHALPVSPSASVIARSLDGRPSRTGSVLAVAQPGPRGFEALPSAASEARLVGRVYSGATVRIGEEMTAAEFLDAAGRAANVHYAGHATMDELQPGRSALIFESAEAAEPLTARTIARHKLASRPLVTLAACSTGSGRLRRNEGIDSLASAFLQAGARGVVATLWDVDDAPSAALFRAFHDNLRRGARPSAALRDAQLSLLNGTDPRGRGPEVWGSSVVIGTR